MTEKRYRSAQERHTEIQANAQALGIDEDYISLLVDTFYSRIRVHEQLGPIFESQIEDRWADHLATMKSFWSSVALNSGSYSGRPLPAHIKLRQVHPSHFESWLDLFSQTLKDTAQSPEAVTYFLERANRIARSLQLAMFSPHLSHEAK